MLLVGDQACAIKEGPYSLYVTVGIRTLKKFVSISF